MGNKISFFKMKEPANEEQFALIYEKQVEQLLIEHAKQLEQIMEITSANLFKSNMENVIPGSPKSSFFSKNITPSTRKRPREPEQSNPTSKTELEG